MTPPSPVPAPERPWLVYAICEGSGPVVIGAYETEPEQRRAYTAARKRLADGGYSADVRDVAVGEDPAYRKHIEPLPSDWPAALAQLALL